MKKYPENIDVQKAEEAGIRFYHSDDDAELAYLRQALKRTPEERFFFLMRLMKEGVVMKRAIRIK